MGDAIAYHGRTAVNSGGSHTFTYIHDPKGKPSRVGIIAAAIESGTQTGDVAIYFGGSPENDVQIHGDAFTANDPYTIINPNFVIHPGQSIRIVFSTITAGDVIECFIGGH